MPADDLKKRVFDLALDTWERLQNKALDIWRRAPTVVTVSGIGLLLLCSTCCICSGLFGGDEIDDFIDDFEDVVIMYEQAEDQTDVMAETAEIMQKMDAIEQKYPKEAWSAKQQGRLMGLAERFQKAQLKLSEKSWDNIQESSDKMIERYREQMASLDAGNNDDGGMSEQEARANLIKTAKTYEGGMSEVVTSYIKYVEEDGLSWNMADGAILYGEGGNWRATPETKKAYRQWRAARIKASE